MPGQEEVGGIGIQQQRRTSDHSLWVPIGPCVDLECASVMGIATAERLFLEEFPCGVVVPSALLPWFESSSCSTGLCVQTELGGAEGGLGRELVRGKGPWNLTFAGGTKVLLTGTCLLLERRLFQSLN